MTAVNYITSRMNTEDGGEMFHGGMFMVEQNTIRVHLMMALVPGVIRNMVIILNWPFLKIHLHLNVLKIG